MDVLTAMELADKLGGVAKETTNYDNIVLTEGHYGRLKADVKDASTEISFNGIKVIASPFVPDGYGVLRDGEKVMGICNFKDGTVLTIKSN